MRLSLLRHFQKDNVVYHGLAGHFFVRNVPHVLKVRINRRHGRPGAAGDGTGKDRQGGRAPDFEKTMTSSAGKWSRGLYGIDTKDSCLYDLVIHIKKIGADEAVDLITHAVDMECFRTTDESRKAMNDLLLAAEVTMVLQDIDQKIQVSRKRRQRQADPGPRGEGHGFHQ